VTTGDTGVYVAYVEFDEAGEWGVEITGSSDGENIGPIALPFEVFTSEQVLNVGDPAPRSTQKLPVTWPRSARSIACCRPTPFMT
jgi:hypothetical protein